MVLLTEQDYLRLDIPTLIKRYKRAEAETLYRQVFAANDIDTMRWLGANDRYFLLTCLLRRPDARHDWLYARCREVEADPDDHLDLWARIHYKGCHLDEQVPTPTGWAAHGDLRPGDPVFGADGRPCRVVARTEVFQAPPEHRITFDDGFQIVTTDDHLWRVDRHTRRRVKGTWKLDGVGKRVYRETVLMTTREIAAWNHRVDGRLRIAAPAPLDLPELDLPIAPYVLGCWLGDGTSANGQITCGDDIWSEIEKTDHVGRDKTPHENADLREIECLTTRLRATGLIKNKHIPQIYLRASADQRLALLQGLMDTDGHCDRRGTATFVNINERLVDGVYELLASLGIKPHKRKVAGRHNGEPYPYFHLSFQARKDRPPFRLERKLARCRDTTLRNYSRYIVACERVEPRPGSCIQVDSPDGMYLVGHAMIPTHNSTIITFAGIIQELIRDSELTVGIFAHNRPAAKSFLNQIKQELQTNELLKSIYPDRFWSDPERLSPKWSLDEGITIKRETNPKEASVEAWGLVEGLPTGKHFRLRVYDDVVTEKSVTGPDMISKVSDAFDLSDDLGVPGGRMWMIGTRYHYGDTYGIVLQRGIIKERRYPATHDGTFEGRPVFLTEEQWARTKSRPKKIVAAQQLLNPLHGAETTFDLKLLKFWTVRPKRVNIYILGDPSKGRTNRSDFTAMSVIGVDIHRNKYLVDGVRHRMNLSRRWQTLRDLHKRWTRMPGVGTVFVGYEAYGLQTDLEYFEERMEIEQYPFAIEEVAWVREGAQSKADRIERLEPDIRSGKFLLPAVRHIDEALNITTVDPSKQRFAQETIAAGESWRVARPILKLDEDNQVYDLLDGIIEEIQFFPFAPHDDFLDASSRIYDMDATPPIHYDDQPGHAFSTEPEIFFDGV